MDASPRQIYIPHFNIGNPSGWYASPSASAWVNTLPVSRIMPTQAWLCPTTVEHYNGKTRMVDSSGQLPFGIRFAGSQTVYLIDGHHRWYSCLLRGRKRFRLLVDDYKVTYAQAMVNAYRQSQPSTHRPRKLAAANPQQMQLSLR